MHLSSPYTQSPFQRLPITPPPSRPLRPFTQDWDGNTEGPHVLSPSSLNKAAPSHLAPKIAPKIAPKLRPKIRPKMCPILAPKIAPKIAPKMWPKMPPKAGAQTPHRDARRRCDRKCAPNFLWASLRCWSILWGAIFGAIFGAPPWSSKRHSKPASTNEHSLALAPTSTPWPWHVMPLVWACTPGSPRPSSTEDSRPPPPERHRGTRLSHRTCRS